MLKIGKPSINVFFCSIATATISGESSNFELDESVFETWGYTLW